jgi:opacity protein-like surface antigen
MRRIIPAVLAAALASAVLAAPAVAFDHHFSVLAKHTRQSGDRHNFTIKQHLYNIRNQSQHVGDSRLDCRTKHAGKLECQGVVDLDGQVGGRGRLKINGDIERGDNKINVVGGTRNFNGVAGKLTFHSRHGNRQRLSFDLIR